MLLLMTTAADTLGLMSVLVSAPPRAALGELAVSAALSCKDGRISPIRTNSRVETTKPGGSQQAWFESVAAGNQTGERNCD
jgi:hypothetical protein